MSWVYVSISPFPNSLFCLSLFPRAKVSSKNSWSGCSPLAIFLAVITSLCHWSSFPASVIAFIFSFASVSDRFLFSFIFAISVLTVVSIVSDVEFSFIPNNFVDFLILGGFMRSMLWAKAPVKFPLKCPLPIRTIWAYVETKFSAVVISLSSSALSHLPSFS